MYQVFKELKHKLRRAKLELIKRESGLLKQTTDIEANSSIVRRRKKSYQQK